MSCFYQTRDQIRRQVGRRVTITPQQLEEIAKVLGIADPSAVATLMLSVTRREAPGPAAPAGRPRAAAPRTPRRRQE